MPNLFGRNDFNIGEDVSCTIMSSAGDTFPADRLGHIKDLDVDFDDDHVQVKTISRGGGTLNEVIPRGVSGKMSLTRADGSFGRLIIESRRRFKEQGERISFSFQYQIRNRDGSVDSYLVTGAKIMKAKLFNASAGKEVDCSFQFVGGEIELTSGN